MVSLTLVGKSLPRPTGPSDSLAAKQLPTDELFAAVVTVARVGLDDAREALVHLLATERHKLQALLPDERVNRYVSFGSSPFGRCNARLKLPKSFSILASKPV